MELVPAILLKGGKCVVQGNKAGEYVSVETDPTQLVANWIEKGVERLHLVDIDGIKRGSAANPIIVEQVIAAAGSAAVQLRGGLRDEETVQQYLELGVQYIVLGSRAVTAPHFVKDLCIEYPGHILVGLDIHAGKIAVDGWSKLSNHDVHDLVDKYQNDGVDGIVYSAVNEDGSTREPDSDEVHKIATEITIPVFAATTANNANALRAFCKQAGDELGGAIVVNAANTQLAHEDFIGLQ